MTNLLYLTDTHCSDTESVSLDTFPAILGRDEKATVKLTNWLTTRRHCEAFQQSGNLWIRDLHSMNGTLVNGEPICERQMKNGDEVRIGLSTFRVTIERQQSAAMP